MTDAHTDAVQQTARKKRVQRLKKIMIAALIAAIFLPTALCVCLLIKTEQLEGQMKDMQQMLVSEMKKVQNTEQELVSSQSVLPVEEEEYSVSEPEELFTNSEEPEPETEKIRKVYLTFDDGPSIYTGEILDILKEYDVKATFFVIGKEGEEYEALYNRIVDEGHTLGMHSYSHKYNEIYESKEAFAGDLSKLREYLYDVTGVESKLYRFPGGSANTVSKTDMGELITYLDEQGITYFDWNVASGDASGSTLSVEQIVDNCTENMDYYNNAFILMHDSKEKHTTVEALPIVIEKIRALEHTQIVPITEDTVPVQQRKN